MCIEGNGFRLENDIRYSFSGLYRDVVHLDYLPGFFGSGECGALCLGSAAYPHATRHRLIPCSTVPDNPDSGYFIAAYYLQRFRHSVIGGIEVIEIPGGHSP